MSLNTVNPFCDLSITRLAVFSSQFPLWPLRKLLSTQRGICETCRGTPLHHSKCSCGSHLIRVEAKPLLGLLHLSQPWYWPPSSPFLPQGHCTCCPHSSSQCLPIGKADLGSHFAKTMSPLPCFIFPHSSLSLPGMLTCLLLLDLSIHGLGVSVAPGTWDKHSNFFLCVINESILEPLQ